MTAATPVTAGPPGTRGRWSRPAAIDLAAVGFLVALAAVLRLPGLEARGRFDYDQGGDMLTLRSFVQDGVIPLLGPKASVGDFHHGAFTFYLLAPSAWLSGSQPLAVTFEIALIGIAAVAATWWMGRVMGGRLVAFIGGLLLAVSPAAVDESIFIWNPNPIPFFAAISAGAAWRGHQTGRARWWILAIGAAGCVAQLHVLGLLFLVPILGLLVVDLASARGPERGALWRGLVGGLVVVGILYVPLAMNELLHDFSETRAIVAYLTSGGGATLDPATRLIVTTFRVVGWPFVGLVTDVPLEASLVVAIVAGLLLWHAVGGSALAGPARWIVASIAWFVVGLTFAAPTLANVVPGLPNDHYHAFADPLLVVGVALAGVSIARGGVVLLRRRATGPRAPSRLAAAGQVVVQVLLGGLLVAQLGIAWSRQPAPDPNGGWPAAEAAGRRIVGLTASSPVRVAQLPDFEPGDGIAFPIVYAGGALATDAVARYLVVGCDRLFVTIIGADCGGPAETAALPGLTGPTWAGARLVDRFDATPQVSVSVYDLGPG